jgi:phosphatidylserine/phosphatidylglycerophosphate/cardiolipin synthase-like enzyme
MRYGGARLPAVRGVATAPAAVRNPIPAIARVMKVTASAQTWVESQLIPFPIRAVVSALPFGVPTFYLVFDDLSGPALSPERDCPLGANGMLRTSMSFMITMVGQDRISRDPILWTSQITTAINAVGGDSSSWTPFASAVTALGAGTAAPLLVLDHVGQSVSSGTIELSSGVTTHQVVLTAADRGDLRLAVQRLHAADPIAMPIMSPWDLAAPLVVRPGSQAGGPSSSIQISGVEDGMAAQRELQVSISRRHVMFTDLDAWFAPQTAIPTTAGAPVPARYRRGNRVRTYVNGPEYFDDWFRLLHQATGLHLAGWDVWPNDVLTRRRSADPANLPVTLAEAATLIGGRTDPTNRTNVLASRFYQLQNPAAVTPTVGVLLEALIATMLILQLNGVKAATSNPIGIALMALAWFGAIVATDYILSSGGQPIEPNIGARDTLNAIARTTCILDAYPALQADNPRQQNLPTFGMVDHWGIFHQKLSIVRTPAGHSGFCGGVDANPNRLDDVRHLITLPFHDVHARIEGPAVADLALTFAERWAVVGGTTPLAFPTPTAAALAAEVAGDVAANNVVQVARTYFTPAAGPTHSFAFAPTGDRTIHDTLVKAIGAAREFIYIEDQYLTPPPSYIDALVAAVQTRRVKRLIVTVPALADQPFGEIIRSGLVQKLRAVDDPSEPIVHVGYPRVRFRLPEISLQAESGRLLLGEEILSTAQGGGRDSITLGPPSRLPAPPFWVCCEGEYMWVYDETALGGGLDSNKWRAFLVDRGGDTKLVSTDTFSLLNPRTRTHAAGAPVSMVVMPSVYVHAKMMIVDDCFLSLGSANLNRRGMFHDGEANVHVVPEPLRTLPSNPVAALRRRVWAEMLDLPEDLAAPLLQDPVAAAALFTRSPLLGNRYVDIDARPTNLSLNMSLGDGWVGNAFGVLGFSLQVGYANNLFDTAIDPTSALDPRPAEPPQ